MTATPNPTPTSQIPSSIIDNVAPVRDFLASAQRFGLPMPYAVGITDYGGVTIQVDAAEFDPWVEYTSAEVGEPTDLAGGSTHHFADVRIEYTDVRLRIVWVETAADKEEAATHAPADRHEVAL